jgi:hypothetical protein
MIAHADAFIAAGLGRPGGGRRDEAPVADPVQNRSYRPDHPSDEVEIPTLDFWVQAVGEFRDLGAEEFPGLLGLKREDRFFHGSQWLVLEGPPLGVEILQLQ